MAWFHSAGIIAKQHNDPHVTATLARLVGHLNARGVSPCFEEQTAQLAGAGGTGMDLETLGRRCDLIIVVGGDGTLLHTAREMADFDLPLVGINLGRLGFLVDISPDHIEDRLDLILSGAYDADTRTLLDARLAGGPEVGRALNDVVIHKWNTVRMIEFETYIDGRFVNAQRSDGLIVATPTGSTAYALSGGGPLIHPSLDALLLVPICPHTLSNRPLVVPGGSRIEVRLRNPGPGLVRLTCDGQIDLPLDDDTPIVIERSHARIRLLHPRGHDHYGILRAKLGWGGHAGQDMPC